MKSGKPHAVIIAVLVIIAAYAVIVTFMFFQPAGATSAAAAVKEIYELQYESPAEILSVNETSGMFDVKVKFRDYSGNETTNDVFVTRDGRLIADRLIISETYKRMLAAQKNFSECLFNKGLRILGQADDAATLQQLDVLGVYAYKVFVSCDGTNDVSCKNLGVLKYPTTVYNNTGYDSFYSAQFLADMTGCQLPTA
jgi:hypothetical protein